MRVIAGKARRTLLKTIEGKDTRPTTDRIKETLFNILQPYLFDASFLDLFSGSGAIGIEALSRGALKAVFVENNRLAVKCIEENLQKTKLFNQATVQALDVITAIRRLDGEDAFTIIYMDPPYNGGFEESVLMELSKSSLVNEDTILIIEAAIDKKLPFISSLGYELTREKCYKTNKHMFLKFIGEK